MSSATSAPRPNGSTTTHHDDALSANGTHLTQEPRPPPAPPVAANPNKKGGKAKKPIDSTETSKLLAQRISQLEHDAAGEKDQEAEIGACLQSSSELRLRGVKGHDKGRGSKLSHAH